MPTRRRPTPLAEAVEAGLVTEEEAESVEAPDVATTTLRSGIQALRGDAVAHSKVGDRLSWADVKDLLDQLLNLPD